MQVGWALGLSLVLVAFTSALGGIGLLAVLAKRHDSRRSGLFADGPGSTLFIFDGERLIDASPSARSLLAAAAMRGPPWHRLMAFLAPRFPQLDDQIAALAQKGRIVLNSSQPKGEAPMTFLAESRSGLTRISLSDPDADGMLNVTDPLTLRAMEEELRLLRGTVAHLPLPIWLESAKGEVIWANSGYLELATSRLGPEYELAWPLPKLIHVKGDERQRVKVGTTTWFDTHVHPADDGRMIYALPIDGLVHAEAALSEFTQTLTKTFAHLPIGLAIFDRQRQLALFNPALHDLTCLPPEFLSLRPSLFDFLDRMRERRMIPEPEDYPDWRQRIINLEKAAAQGLYNETWNLPGGQTYRVLARPHPDGALALLFEDISNEMSRTRRYRSEVELGQAVMDSLDEALAVFSPSGLLVMSNTAYTALWGHDPAGSLAAESGITMLADHWRKQTATSPIWEEAEDFVVTLGERKAWDGDARLSDGRLLRCRFVPLAGGATLIGFRVALGGEAQAHGLVFTRARVTA